MGVCIINNNKKINYTRGNEKKRSTIESNENKKSEVKIITPKSLRDGSKSDLPAAKKEKR
jgi:hypothetical protein